MSHKKLRPFIVKVSVLGYFPLTNILIIICKRCENYKKMILQLI